MSDSEDLHGSAPDKSTAALILIDFAELTKAA